LLQRHTRRISRHGLAEAPPLLYFTEGRRGHGLSIGLELQRLPTPQGELRVVNVSTPADSGVEDFYAVPTRVVQRFYRFVRKLNKTSTQQVAPILSRALSDALWSNTIGWLTRDRQRLAQYNLPQRRGVLLLGSPGNGKTMACRWLRCECLRRGLEWNNISRQQYESALVDGDVRELFELERPGVVLFDDFDAGLKDRAKYGDHAQGTFLTEMDGMSPKSGVVYLFTSNLDVADIDPAARRPGRIDSVLRFDAPDAALRRRLIRERWPAEIVDALPIETIVAETAGLSFAELEEARKMVVLHYLDTNEIRWANVQKDLAQQRKATADRRVIGFRAEAREVENAVSACHV
jgi:hypothetical protein